MGTIVKLPIYQDGTIYRETDWQEWDFIFYQDAAQTTVNDFSLSTFAGEVLDEKGGTKLFDLTFNSPANDGRIFPKLTSAQTATLTGKTCWYFVTVTTSGVVLPYITGSLTISEDFEAGA